MVAETDDEDAAFRLFEDWLIEYEDGTKIWDWVWTLGQDGLAVSTPNWRKEAIDACTLKRTMAPNDLGAQELGVASVRHRRELEFEFCRKQDGGEWQGRRFVEEGRGEEERISEMERGVRSARVDRESELAGLEAWEMLVRDVEQMEKVMVQECKVGDGKQVVVNAARECVDFWQEVVAKYAVVRRGKVATGWAARLRGSCMVAGEWWRREEMAEWEEAVVGRRESFERESWVCEENIMVSESEISLI